jgi:hypothetical protein
MFYIVNISAFDKMNNNNTSELIAELDGISVLTTFTGEGSVLDRKRDLYHFAPAVNGVYKINITSKKKFKFKAGTSKNSADLISLIDNTTSVQENIHAKANQTIHLWIKNYNWKQHGKYTLQVSFVPDNASSNTTNSDTITPTGTKLCQKVFSGAINSLKNKIILTGGVIVKNGNQPLMTKELVITPPSGCEKVFGSCQTSGKVAPAYKFNVELGNAEDGIFVGKDQDYITSDKSFSSLNKVSGLLEISGDTIINVKKSFNFSGATVLKINGNITIYADTFNFGGMTSIHIESGSLKLIGNNIKFAAAVVTDHEIVLFAKKNIVMAGISSSKIIAYSDESIMIAGAMKLKGSLTAKNIAIGAAALIEYDKSAVDDYCNHGTEPPVSDVPKFNIWDQDESISHQVIKTKIVGEDINLTFASLDENGTQFKTTDIDNIKVALFSEGHQITIWKSLVLENNTHMNISFQPSIFRWFDSQMQISRNYQNKAFKDVVVKMQYTDENNVVHTVSSTDHFAIRPYAYKITPDSSNLVAGEDFNLTLQAVDRNNNIITNYVEDTTVYTIEANETKSGQGCNHGGSINIQKHNFTHGETKSEVSYADIGELTFKIHEIDTKEFASIDRNDTSAAQRFIRGATIVSSEIKPADISIEWELENGDNVNQYTYFNDYNHTDPDRQMSAKFNVSVSLLNKTGDNVKNFTAECDYAKDISLQINYLSQSIESGGYEIVGEYKDQNDTYATSLSTLPSNIDIGDNSFSGYKLEKTLFKFGLGIKKAEFSLKRDVDVPREPLLFTIKDVTAMVPSSTLTKTKYNPTTVKFLYARAHIPDQKIVGNKGDAHVFYEVYCKDSNRTQFGLDGLEESKDSIYWYILKNINETYSDFSVPPSLNGFGTYAGITANYNGFLSAVSHTSNNILHIESAKSTSVVRIKYKPKKYLVFNRFNATANNHSFTAIFTPKEKSWGGKGSVGHTVDMVVSPRNNMNIIDW